MSLKKILASMSIVLGSDTKGFEQGMKKSKTELQDFAKKATGMAKIAVAAFGSVSTAAIVAANKAAEYADEIDKTAISTGLQRDTLQKLSYVADQAGVQFSTLASSMAKLNRTIGDAAYGNKRQVEAFEKLGVSIYDAEGNMKSMEVMFPQVVSALNKMENETERNALAMDLFGRGASELVPRLAELGDDGIKKLTEKAEKLHLTMSDKGISTLVKYKDDMATLKQQMGAIVREGIVPFASAITEHLLPVMSNFLEKIAIWQSKRLVDKIQREQTELNTLVTTLISANDNEQLRSSLISEIKDKYPDFLKGLSDEEIAVGALRDRLKEANEQYALRISLLAIEAETKELTREGVTLKLEQRDIAKEMRSIAEGNIDKDFIPLIEENLYEYRDGKLKLTDDIEKIAEFFASVSYGVLGSNSESAARHIVKNLNALGGRFLEIQAEIAQNAEQYASLIYESQKYTQKLYDSVAQYGDRTGAFSNNQGSSSSNNASGDSFANSIIQGDIDFSRVTGISTLEPIINDSIKSLDNLGNKLTDIKFAVMDFSSVISKSFSDMAYGIGENLGHAISGVAGYDSVLQGIMDSFGAFAQQMGALFIAYGVAGKNMQYAVSHPYTAIAAGVALVAIGTVIRDSAANPSISGGVSPATISSNSYSGPSTSQGKNTFELVWRRAGPDLVAIIDSERASSSGIFNR